MAPAALLGNCATSFDSLEFNAQNRSHPRGCDPAAACEGANMKVIVVIGGIGSGKSTVSAAFRDLGAGFI
ncbi:MAG: dephospho-CoA kinase, partial [Coriobacteriia bacterium]|nr:dephospho-CoA kinase [Coriobacteriia bacterium]